MRPLRPISSGFSSKYSLFQKHTTQAILLREANVFFLTMLMAYVLIFFMKNFFRKTSLWVNMFIKSIILIILFILTQLIIEINEKYSPGVFADIVLGKYVQPKDERRSIMFIDLKDSTTIVEKLELIKQNV